MTESDLIKKIQHHIQSLIGFEPTEEAMLTEIDALDSIKFIHLVNHIEKDFNVEFDVDELEEKFKSLKLLAGTIHMKLVNKEIK